MRLIDADALERAYDDKYTLGDCGRRERDDVVDALRDAPTVEPAPPWHRVEGELPHENTNVLFYDEKGYFHDGIMSRFRGYTEFIDVDGNTLHGITHWMPIEPPQEDA